MTGKATAPTGNEPKERPVIFSRPMVRAILRGEKTQTRRIVRNPGYGAEVWRYGTPHDEKAAIFGGGPYLRIAYDEETDLCGQRIRCPHGRVGDGLWVRETFQVLRVHIDPETGYGDDFSVPEKIPKDNSNDYWGVSYAASDPMADDHPDDRGFVWRPSIYMPRWACRLTLRISEVRVQKLQEVTEEDAVAEGVDAIGQDDVPRGAAWSRRDDFAKLWNNLNAKRGFSWEFNPWVWALSFTLLVKPEAHGV